MWGIRTAGASATDVACDHLIAQLDDYMAHGVNTVAVFYMGCSGANQDPFSPDGGELDAGNQGRMERIIEACAERRMVVICGIFYQRAPFGLRDAEAVRAAVRTVTEALRPYRNIIINPCNEQNSPRWAVPEKASIFAFNDPERIIELCGVVHEVDPARLVGGGGYDRERSLQIGKSREADVLLFDNPHDQPSGELAEYFFSGGVREKPLVNVEVFGGWTKQFSQGVFSETVRGDYLREIAAAERNPALSVFFHNNPWCQGDHGPMRFDLGGYGTEDDPGIRWYFESVREARARSGS